MDKLDKVDRLIGHMAPSAAQRAFALRMDYVMEDKEKLREWHDKQSCGSYLVVYEDHAGENPHIHSIFWSDKKMEALRKSFKRLFNDKTGNGAYSLKECDDDTDAYLRYMCKGGSKSEMAVVLMKCGLDYDDERLKSSHEEYWVNNELLRHNKRKREALRKMSVVEQVEKIAKEEGVRKNDREGIAKIYIRMYREARKPINSFAARAVVNTVQCLLDDTGEVMEDLARQIAGV